MYENLPKINPDTHLSEKHKVLNPNLKQDKPTKPIGIKSLPKIDTKLNFDKNTTIEGISESQYNINISPLTVEKGNLDKARAVNQPFHHEMANSLTRVGTEAVGGAVEGFGLVTELLQANKLTLHTDNVLVNLGRDIKEAGTENFKIYNSDPGGFMLNSSENFWENFVSIGSTLALMIPTVGTFKLLGGLGKGLSTLSKGNKMLSGLGKIPQFTKYQKFIATGVSQATFSRQLENNLEAFQTYEGLLKDGLTHEQSKEAALEVYNKNWAMLIQDIPQYLAFGKVFNPMTGKFVKNATKTASKLSPKYSKALGLAGVASGEAMEEAYQYLVSQEAEYGAKFQAGMIDYKNAAERSSDYFSDANFWNSVVMGAAGGAVFQTVMPALQGNSKADKSNREKQEASYIASRGAIFKNLTELTANADQTNNEPHQIRARKHSNHLLVQNALLHDRYEEHIGWLDTLMNLTPEEQAQLEQEEGITLGKDILDKVIPALKKDSESIKNEFLKNVNKYGAQRSSLIALNKIKLEGQHEVNKELLTQFETLQKELLFDEGEQPVLDPISKEYFDIVLNENAYASSKLNKALLISNDPQLSTKQKEFELAKIETNYVKAIEALNAKRANIATRDERTKEQKSVASQMFSNLNQKDGITTEGELVRAKSNYLNSKQEVERLENEKSYLTSSKFDFDKTGADNLNNINKEDDLGALRNFGSSLQDKGQLSAIINEYRTKEAELSKKLEKDLNLIADKVIKKMEKSDVKYKYAVNNLSPKEKALAEKYEKELKSVYNNKVQSDKPAPEVSPVKEQVSNSDVVDKNVDISVAHPSLEYTKPEDKKDVERYLSWVEEPQSYKDYTAIITKSFDENKKPIYKVTFKDTKGNPAMYNGVEVFTYLAVSNTNLRFVKFKEDIDNNLDENNQVTVKVKKQEVPDFNDENQGNNNIYDVFGANVEVLYTDAAGKFVPYGSKKNEAAAKVIGDRLGTKTKRAGLVYAVVKNINGVSMPVKLNTPRIKELKGAADVVYEIYKHLLTEGVENMVKYVPQELLDKLPFDAEMFKTDGNVTYTDLLDQLVYDSPSTKGTKGALDSQASWVNFGNNQEQLFSENDTINYDDILDSPAEVKEDSIMSYTKIDGNDHVVIRKAGGVASQPIPIKLRKGLPSKLTKENVEDMKQNFIDFLNSNKRLNVKVIKNKEYLDNLIANKMLTTDKAKGKIFVPITYKTKGMVFVNPFTLSKKETVLKESVGTTNMTDKDVTNPFAEKKPVVKPSTQTSEIDAIEKRRKLDRDIQDYSKDEEMNKEELYEGKYYDSNGKFQWLLAPSLDKLNSKINAKYDAELAALKSTPQSNVKSDFKNVDSDPALTNPFANVNNSSSETLTNVSDKNTDAMTNVKKDNTKPKVDKPKVDEVDDFMNTLGSNAKPSVTSGNAKAPMTMKELLAKQKEIDKENC
jgi:hypothetical protein